MRNWSQIIAVGGTLGLASLALGQPTPPAPTDPPAAATEPATPPGNASESATMSQPGNPVDEVAPGHPVDTATPPGETNIPAGPQNVTPPPAGHPVDDSNRPSERGDMVGGFGSGTSDSGSTQSQPQ